MAKKSLRDVVVTYEKVYYTTEDYFEVRGISLADIIELMKKNADKLGALFNDFMARKGPGDLSSQIMTDFLIDALTDAPDIAGEVIAIASDDPSPEGVAAVRKLRTPVLIDALMKVAALSITSEAELKKLVETLTSAVTKVTGLVKNLKSDLDSDEDEPFRFPDGFSAPVVESVN